jgi:hypothetical protein
MSGVMGSVATGAQMGTMVAGPVGTAIGAGIGLLGAGLSFMGASSKRKEAEAQMGMIEQQQYSIGQALRGLGENIAMKQELAEDVYGSGVDKAMFQTGQSLYGLTRQGMGAAARTGFASSGQVQAQTQRAQEAGVAQFGFQRQSLQDILGQKLMDISEFEGAERGRLESEQARLAAEMQQQRRAASGSGFFQNLMGG